MPARPDLKYALVEVGPGDKDGNVKVRQLSSAPFATKHIPSGLVQVSIPPSIEIETGADGLLFSHGTQQFSVDAEATRARKEATYRKKLIAHYQEVAAIETAAKAQPKQDFAVELAEVNQKITAVVTKAAIDATRNVGN